MLDRDSTTFPRISNISLLRSVLGFVVSTRTASHSKQWEGIKVILYAKSWRERRGVPVIMSPVCSHIQYHCHQGSFKIQLGPWSVSHNKVLSADPSKFLEARKGINFTVLNCKKVSERASRVPEPEGDTKISTTFNLPLHSVQRTTGFQCLIELVYIILSPGQRPIRKLA